MAIQQGNPATLEFNFRRYSEDGEDLGPMDLTDAEFLPISVKLRRPYTTENITVEQANVTIVDAVNGEVEYIVPVGTLDVVGPWRAQAFAGDWKSRIVYFPVEGPNL